MDGEVQNAKGAFDYGLGQPKREFIVGSDRVHGFKEMPQVAFIEGKITDRGDLNVKNLVNGKGLTVSIRVGNGKLITLHDAAFTGDGKINTEEGEIDVRWEGSAADEVAI